jgi:hypothetical protein
LKDLAVKHLNVILYGNEEGKPNESIDFDEVNNSGIYSHRI